jgi:hypothetical protein
MGRTRLAISLFFALICVSGCGGNVVVDGNAAGSGGNSGSGGSASLSSSAIGSSAVSSSAVSSSATSSSASGGSVTCDFQCGGPPGLCGCSGACSDGTTRAVGCKQDATGSVSCSCDIAGEPIGTCTETELVCRLPASCCQSVFGL